MADLEWSELYYYSECCEHSSDYLFNCLCSIKDLKDVGLCVEELNASSYHTAMISSWILDSLEKSAKERELLLKLLLHLHKREPVLLSLDELLRGYFLCTCYFHSGIKCIILQLCLPFWTCLLLSYGCQ